MAVSATLAAHQIAEERRRAGLPVLPMSFGDLSPRLSGTTGAQVAEQLLTRHGLALLPGVEFGEPASSLSFRVATGQLTGRTDDERRAVLAADDPLEVPWVASALDHLSGVLATVLR
jgi:aspartate/methionine/tyrosine aminotransferase